MSVINSRIFILLSLKFLTHFFCMAFHNSTMFIQKRQRDLKTNIYIYWLIYIFHICWSVIRFEDCYCDSMYTAVCIEGRVGQTGDDPGEVQTLLCTVMILS